MDNGKLVRKENTPRKKLAELAGGLASAGDLAAFLGEKKVLPSAVIRTLTAKRALVVIRDMRKVVAMQKYLRLELTAAQLAEICRETDESFSPPPPNVAVQAPPAEPRADEATLAAAMKQMAEEDDSDGDP